MGSVVPWLTFRGLPTDRLEGFSADLRLTFRGLPAEGLWFRTRETASFPIPRPGTNEALGWLPQEGLSWAAPGFSNRGDTLLGFVVCFLDANLVGNVATIAASLAFRGTSTWVVGC